MTELIVATKNAGKVKEIREILSAAEVEVKCLEDLPDTYALIEDGRTFEENAAKKAIPVSRVYPRVWTAGEDSGLEVDALDGAPGIFSKRYSGADATDQKNNEKLLAALRGLPPQQRTARYRCCVVLARAGRAVKVCEGVLEGVIAVSPQGNGGFGYDPIFSLPEYGKTIAQLSSAEKNAVSHRGRAFEKVRDFLQGSGGRQEIRGKE
ncbi:MAG: XTP/dITP diphosphatase [Candidatus Omnitrophica bacterium]|nr:XTP/dITP diphosphatase [Candidatus Omnitrophota bacterium]